MDGPRPAEEMVRLRERFRAFRFASRMTRRSPLPVVLLLVQAAAWVAYVALAPPGPGGGPHPAAILVAGAKVNALIAAGEWWRLPASVFLHADAAHLLVNLVGTWFLAQLADNLFGTARTVLVYLAGGIGGALVSMALLPEASLGSSGAVYALMGAVAAFVLGRHRDLPLAIRRSLVAGTAVWGGITLAYGFAMPAVDHAAHAGGLAVGAALALAFGRRLPVLVPGAVRSPAWVRGAAAVLALATGVSMAIGGMHLAGRFDLAVPALEPLALPGGPTVPVPAGWMPGRIWERACRPQEGTPPAELVQGGSACFRDPYGTLLLIGRTRDLGRDDPDARPGPTREVREQGVSKRLVPLDDEWFLILMAYDFLSDHYDATLAAIVVGVRGPTSGPRPGTGSPSP